MITKRRLLMFLKNIPDDYEIICENNLKRILGLEEESEKYEIRDDAVTRDDDKRIVYLEIR